MAAEWGSISKVVNAPLIDVKGDETWLSVIGMWLFLPLNLAQGIIGGLCKGVLVSFTVGNCCLPCSDKWCSVWGSVQMGRPLWLAWNWWRTTIAALIALLANSKSRLALFIWEWEAFGSVGNFFHGSGFWSVSYEECDAIAKSNQGRSAAFGCMNAPVPDLFATNLLIFLSNDGPESEWGAIRQAVHSFFLDVGNTEYQRRVQALPAKIAEDWPSPKLADMNDTALVQRTVCKCVFYVMFGEWISFDEAEILAGWRRNATFFILPRLLQRFLFNLGIRKVKKLREDTVRIVEARGLESTFVRMNDSLPEAWRRTPVVKLCDEIMYVIGFAGMGGTSACVETVGQFLQVKIPAESASNAIEFGRFKTSAEMVAAYKENSEAYIKEACRLDPPVTSATQVLRQSQEVELAGRQFNFPAGSLNQYVVSMANRDESVFEKPQLFDPDRANLGKALTWNGAFQGNRANDEASYPRICPGRYLSLQVTEAIVNHVLSFTPPSSA
jgi:cytochrome P450